MYRQCPNWLGDILRNPSWLRRRGIDARVRRAARQDARCRQVRRRAAADDDELADPARRARRAAGGVRRGRRTDRATRNGGDCAPVGGRYTRRAQGVGHQGGADGGDGRRRGRRRQRARHGRLREYGVQQPDAAEVLRAPGGEWTRSKLLAVIIARAACRSY